MSCSPRPRPNLFSFATSELSQDAFLAWLLAWADPAHGSVDAGLHGVAQDFIAALFDRAGVSLPPGEVGISVSQQVGGADVVAEVGSDHLLIIEDKVYSAEHSDQLRRYRDLLRDDYSGRTLACVYLKTGDQSNYGEVERAGWAVFTRQDLLDVLRRARGTVDHDVFIDFLEHVESIEKASGRFRTAPPSEWARHDDAYPGLYRALQADLSDADWGFVNNPRGGFYGFWWSWREIEGGHIYLQLEEHELVVKVEVEERDRRRDVRDTWVDRVVADMGGFRRPARLGHGDYMTVGTSERDYRITDSNGLLDLERIVALLQEVTSRLSRLSSTGANGDRSRTVELDP